MQKSTKVPNNGKFVENIPGWDDLEVKSKCGFKDMGWTRISSIDMGRDVVIGEM